MSDRIQRFFFGNDRSLATSNANIFDIVFVIINIFFLFIAINVADFCNWIGEKL